MHLKPLSLAIDALFHDGSELHNRSRSDHRRRATRRQTVALMEGQDQVENRIVSGVGGHGHFGSLYDFLLYD